MDDFIIAVTDLEPPPKDNAWALDHIGYRRCAQYDGRVPASATVTLQCDERAIGRYLYVYLPYNNILTVCEVQVFGLGQYGLRESRIREIGSENADIVLKFEVGRISFCFIHANEFEKMSAKRRPIVIMIDMLSVNRRC